MGSVAAAHGTGRAAARRQPAPTSTCGWGRNRWPSSRRWRANSTRWPSASSSTRSSTSNACVYEKRKTEAIIESLEDGVVLIDSAGIVTHINEIAALIMDIEPADALGSPFDDLSSNSSALLPRARRAARAAARRARWRRASRCSCTCAGAIIPTCSSRCRCAIAPRARARHAADPAGRHLSARPGSRAQQPGRDALARAAHAAHLAGALGATAATRGGDARSQTARVFAHDPRRMRADEAARRQSAQPRTRRDSASISIAARTRRPRARGRGASPDASASRPRKRHVALERHIDGGPGGQRRSGQAFVGGVEPDRQRAALYSRGWTDRSHRPDRRDDMVRLEVARLRPGNRARNARLCVRALRAVWRRRRHEAARRGWDWRSSRTSSSRMAGGFSSTGNVPAGSRFVVQLPASREA